MITGFHDIYFNFYHSVNQHYHFVFVENEFLLNKVNLKRTLIATLREIRDTVILKSKSILLNVC